MMKNWMKIAILLAVLVVFVTAFILLSNDNKTGNGSATPSPSAASADEVDLVPIERDQITKITLKRGGQDIVLSLVEKEVEKLNKKEDGTTQKIKEKEKVWTAPDFDVDTSTVSSIALAADTAVTKRLIEENPADLAVYGLDKALEITFSSDGGKAVTLQVGGKTPMGDYYIKKSDGNAVYTLDSYKAEKFLYGKLDVMNRNLYGSEALTSDDLSTLSLERDGSKIFESKRTGEDWRITWPVDRGVDIGNMQKFIDLAVQLRANKFIEENPADLKLYGLDKPKYVFSYELAGKNYNVLIGSKKDTEYYALMEGNPTVFALSESLLTFVDLPLIDLIDRFIYIPTIYDVEKLVIEMDGRTDVLLINADKEDNTKEEFRVNGKLVDEEDKSLFKKYYQGAIGLMGDKLDLDAKPSGTAEIRLTYTMKNPGADGKVVTVELIPTNDGYGYYMMKNGQYSGMVIGHRQLNKDDNATLKVAYKNLMEGMSKTN